MTPSRTPCGCRARLLAVLALSSLLCGACARDDRPNILLITLDTVRADHVGCYGAKKGLTPALDALAARGTRFARAVAPAPITLPSHASVLTGRYPVRHGVRDNSVYCLPEEALTLAEHFAGSGYRTGAAVSSIVLSRRFGVQQGFRVFEEGDLIVEDRDVASGGLLERDGAEITEEALRFLKTGDPREGPFFFWAHYYDPHEPYRWHPEIEDSPAETAYESEIRYTDSQVEKLLSYLRESGLEATTVVVAAADHGEGLGEHLESSHIMLTYETTLSVPLIYAGPGIAEGRVIKDSLGRLIDIMPTLVELAGSDPAAGVALDGVSTAPLLSAATAPAPGPEIAYFETMGPVTYDWAPLDGVTTLAWKYIRGPVEELYHLPTDPYELTNVVDASPEVAHRLAEAADAFAAIVPEGEGTMDMAGRQSELFGALGYLSLDVRARKPSRNRPHPRDMVTLLDLSNRAQSYYNMERFDLALPVFERCVRLSPGSAIFHDLLGKTRLKLKDFSGAAASYRKALEIHPEMVDTRIALGLALWNEGNLREAEETLREAIRRAPGLHAGYGYLASLLNQQGRRKDEHQVLEALFENAEIPDPKMERALRTRLEGLGRELQIQGPGGATKRSP